MPFINSEQYHLLESGLGWSFSKVLSILTDLQGYDPDRKRWTDDELAMIKVLRDHNVSYAQVAKILNRRTNAVYKYYQFLDHGADIQKEIEVKQSEGAAQIEKFIKKYFALYKLRREYKLPCQLRLDFYLPQLKLGFEYDGEQHDKFVEHFHKDEYAFRRSVNRDRIKDEDCKKAGIRLIRFSWKERLSEKLFKQKLDEVNWGLK